MPPWSDVRALAESLAVCDEFITFLDVLPLQRMAQALMHMPRATLDAIVHLHRCDHLTLGAKDVLADLLRSYTSRIQGERRLGLKVLRLKDHNKTLRLAVGQQATLVLLRNSAQRWELVARPLMVDGGTLVLQEVEGHGRFEQRVQLGAPRAGAFELEAHLTHHRADAPWAVMGAVGPQGGRPQPKASALRTSFRLTVIVEAC